MFDPAKYNIIDLTMLYTKDVAGYDFEIAKTVEKDGWNARTLQLYSHAGTHMDAPFHFGVNKGTIDDFSPKQLVGKAWVARIKIKQAQQLLSISDLGKILKKIKAGDSLLIRTDWSQHIGQAKYRNKLPRISEELAQWCVQYQVRMLGVEPPSVADVNNLEEVTNIHNILLGGDVIIIEGLMNLDQIKKESVMLVALPLKIKGGDGAPARVIVFEEK